MRSFPFLIEQHDQILIYRFKTKLIWHLKYLNAYRLEQLIEIVLIRNRPTDPNRPVYTWSDSYIEIFYVSLRFFLHQLFNKKECSLWTDVLKSQFYLYPPLMSQFGCLGE